MADASARIPVRNLDQFTNRMLPIAHDVRRYALGAGDDLAVHDEDTMVEALSVVLDDDATRDVVRRLPGRPHRVLVVQPAADSAAMTRVHRLEDDRKPNLFGDLHGPVRRARRFTARHGPPDVAQHALRVDFVLRELDADAAGVV